MYNKPCCYFYIDDDGNVAYVGKANGTLRERVSAHAHEGKFLRHSPRYTIKYVTFDRSSDMDIAEKCYIKSQKPPLNVVDNTPGFFPTIIVDFDAMKTYDPSEGMIPSRGKSFNGSTSHSTEVKNYTENTMWKLAKLREGTNWIEIPSSRKKQNILCGLLCLMRRYVPYQEWGRVDNELIKKTKSYVRVVLTEKQTNMATNCFRKILFVMKGGYIGVDDVLDAKRGFFDKFDEIILSNYARR